MGSAAFPDLTSLGCCSAIYGAVGATSPHRFVSPGMKQNRNPQRGVTLQLTNCTGFCTDLPTFGRHRKMFSLPVAEEGNSCGDLKSCTGFCTDCQHPAATAGYWPSLGGSLEVIEPKGKSCRIRSL